MEINNLLKQKLPTRATLSVLIFLAALFVAFYFATQFWNNYKIRKAEEVAFQNREKAEKEFQAKLREEKRDRELSDLRQQLENLKNKPPEVRTVTKTVEVADATSSIIKEWSKRIAYVECAWTYSNGLMYAKGSGSATLVKFDDLGLRAVTSKHVVLNQEQYPPKECKVVLPTGEGNKIYLVSGGDNISAGINEDWAYLKITEDAVLNDVTKKDIKLCERVEVGDKLLILGYPAIGSQTGLTATEGILSGYDGNYYITSAKIDRGNSGGAAILVKDNCYLGIPSASVVGVIESLGRILKASFVIR